MRRRRKRKRKVITVIIAFSLLAAVTLAAVRYGNGEDIPLQPPAVQQEIMGDIVENVLPPVVGQSAREEEESIFQHGYLSVCEDRIAVFWGIPPDGILQYVTEFEVRDDLRDELEKGVLFTTTEELMQLLESYTS